MDFDRLKGAFAALTRAVMSKVDFFALYPCKVLKQNSDGTLELKPENSKLPGFSQVPIRYTVPGMRVELTGKDLGGCRALVGFDGGDPRKPFVAHFVGPDLTTLDVGHNPVDYAMRGSAYRTAEKQLHQGLSAGLTALAASITAINTALAGAEAPAVTISPATVAAFLHLTLGPLFATVASNVTALQSTIDLWETAAANPLNNEYLSRVLRNT